MIVAEGEEEKRIISLASTAKNTRPIQSPWQFALILGALGIVGLEVAIFTDVGVAVLAILNSMRNLRK